MTTPLSTASPPPAAPPQSINDVRAEIARAGVRGTEIANIASLSDAHVSNVLAGRHRSTAVALAVCGLVPALRDHEAAVVALLGSVAETAPAA